MIYVKITNEKELEKVQKKYKNTKNVLTEYSIDKIKKELEDIIPYALYTEETTIHACTGRYNYFLWSFKMLGFSKKYPTQYKVRYISLVKD